MPERPNLLYMHSDQHSPAVLGCGGDPLVQTPHLDGLAAQGVHFDHVYCPSPVCVASRMAMLAGRYPHETECWTNHDMLDSAVPTLAHAMGAGGYRPVLIGRMHARGPDQLHGYAERLVGDHSGNYSSGAAPGLALSYLRNAGSGQSSYQVHDEDVAAASIDFFNRLGVRRRAGLDDGPFSLSVGFMLPHLPFVARREDYELYRDKTPPPRHAQPFSDELHPFIRWWRQRAGWHDATEEEMLNARAAYWALVSRLDLLIGQILQALRHNGLEENTLVIYTSDHGEQVGEHGLWSKRTFYETSVKVPAILSWPGRLPQGRRCERVLSSLDLNATMLEALQCPALPHARGRSVLDLLTSDAAWEDVAFSEYCLDEGHYHRMIRRDEWKLNYYHGHEPQLFNLRQDPDELVDRAGDPSCREVRDRMIEEVLEGWDPEHIARRMAARREDLKIIADWAKNTRPADQYRWERLPEMDYRD